MISVGSRGSGLLLATLLAAAMMALAIAPRAGGTPAAPAYAKTAANAKRIVADFRAARTEPDRRTDLVEEAVALGPEAVERLKSEIQKELDKALAGYRARLTKLAKPALKKRRARGSELKKLREAVLVLSQDGALSKQRILDEGDPAVERLSELLLVDVHELLTDEEELTADRDALIALGAHWDRCEEILAPARRIEDGQSNEPSLFEEVLARNERLATTLAMSIPGGAKKVLIENAKLAWQIDAAEALGVLDLNILRLMLGLNALRIDVKLCAAARDHSNDMANHEFFSHTSPLPGKRTFSDRASRFRASASSENIAYGHRDPSNTNLGWFHSPGHHKNMLGNHGRIGLGRSRTHWTQLFG